MYNSFFTLRFLLDVRIFILVLFFL